MSPISIRWRLTLWYAAALAVILTGVGVVLLLLVQQQLLQRMDADLQEEVQEVALEIGLTKFGQRFESQLRLRFYHHAAYDFVVSDEQGTSLFVSSGLTSDMAASLADIPATDTPTFTNRLLIVPDFHRIASRSIANRRGTLTIRALTTLRPFNKDLRALTLLLMVLLPLGVACALAGGYFLAARALAPVLQIAKIADSITIAELGRRIQVYNPHDEIGQLANTLNSFIERLERAVTEIQRFAADASHELRTPLSVLKAQAEKTLLCDSTTAETQETLSVIVEEATRLGALTDQLLHLSRCNAGIAQCRRESIPIDALVLDVIDQLRPLAESRGVQIETRTSQCCDVLGDDTRLSQALFNVLDNSIKYSSPGTSTTVSCEVRNGSAYITVKDKGAGIQPEHIPRIFDRFYRADSSRHPKVGGTGLGLAIARTAVEAHNGQINLQSVVGVGTTVTITLPFACTVPDESHASS